MGGGSGSGAEVLDIEGLGGPGWMVGGRVFVLWLGACETKASALLFWRTGAKERYVMRGNLVYDSSGPGLSHRRHRVADASSVKK